MGARLRCRRSGVPHRADQRESSTWLQAPDHRDPSLGSPTMTAWTDDGSNGSPERCSYPVWMVPCSATVVYLPPQRCSAASTRMCRARRDAAYLEVFVLPLHVPRDGLSFGLGRRVGVPELWRRLAERSRSEGWSERSSTKGCPSSRVGRLAGDDPGSTERYVR